MDAAITQAMMAAMATNIGLSPLFHLAFFRNGKAGSLLFALPLRLVSQSAKNQRRNSFWGLVNTVELLSLAERRM